MGGYGSGRWGCGCKTTTESQRSIDIRWLKKHGCLQHGGTGSLSWSWDGVETGSIGYRVEKDRILLKYRYRPQGRDWETVEQKISFNRTPCNYGGYRTWFLCPRCQRRVAVLYGAGKYFFCRHCYGLAYSSQQQAPPFRLSSKAQKIRKLLGASQDTGEPILIKPKGMHWKTFDRLRKKSYQASDQAWEAVARVVGYEMLEQFDVRLY